MKYYGAIKYQVRPQHAVVILVAGIDYANYFNF